MTASPTTLLSDSEAPANLVWGAGKLIALRTRFQSAEDLDSPSKFAKFAEKECGGMGWLVFALVMGIVLGITVRLPQTVMRFLDRSLTVSLVVMLTALGIEVAQNPKLEQALSSHGLSVATLLISVSAVSIAWGWLLERGWALLWRER